MQKIEAVFFDAGHTLLLPDYNVYEEILTKYGIEIEREYLLEKEGEARPVYDELVLSGKKENAWVIFYSKFLELVGVREECIPAIIEEVRKRNSEGLGIWIVKNEGADEVLEGLKSKGLKLGVISNSDGRVEEILKFTRIYHFFGIVVDSDKVGFEKPDKRIFLIGTEALNVSPEKSLYVGDYYSVDYLGAKNAGLIPILYDPVDAYRDLNCRKIRKLIEVLKVVDEISNI